jgi:hypothetical protein
MKTITSAFGCMTLIYIGNYSSANVCSALGDCIGPHSSSQPQHDGCDTRHSSCVCKHHHAHSRHVQSRPRVEPRCRTQQSGSRVSTRMCQCTRMCQFHRASLREFHHEQLTSRLTPHISRLTSRYSRRMFGIQIYMQMFGTMYTDSAIEARLEDSASKIIAEKFGGWI